MPGSRCDRAGAGRVSATDSQRVRWRWGTCPRCGADAWINTDDPLNVAC